MRNIKRLAALLLAVTMSAAMALTVSAADIGGGGTGDVVQEERRYDAYQIFVNGDPRNSYSLVNPVYGKNAQDSFTIDFNLTPNTVDGQRYMKIVGECDLSGFAEKAFISINDGNGGAITLMGTADGRFECADPDWKGLAYSEDPNSGTTPMGWCSHSIKQNHNGREDVYYAGHGIPGVPYEEYVYSMPFYNNRSRIQTFVSVFSDVRFGGIPVGDSVNNDLGNLSREDFCLKYWDQNRLTDFDDTKYPPFLSGLTRDEFDLLPAGLYVMKMTSGTPSDGFPETEYKLISRPERTDGTRTYDVLQILKSDVSADGDGNKYVFEKSAKPGWNGVWPFLMERPEASDAELEAEKKILLDGFAAAAGKSNKEALAAVAPYVDFDMIPYDSDLTKEQINAITWLEPGYYLIRSHGQADPATTYVLQASDGTLAFNPKESVPTVSKQAADGRSMLDAAGGEDIGFVITATLPDNLYDYEQYYMKFTDEPWYFLYNGDVAVRWGDVDITDQVVVSYNNPDNNPTGSYTSIAIEIMDLLALGQPVGKMDDVVITYSCAVYPMSAGGEVQKINGEIYFSGSPYNSVSLEYSNDPNRSTDGKEYTGVTAFDDGSKVKIMVTGIVIEQFDPDGNPLTGSEFELTSPSIKSAGVVGFGNNRPYRPVQQFIPELATGDPWWWMLKSGGFTAVAPTDATRDQYDLDNGWYVSGGSGIYVERDDLDPLVTTTEGKTGGRINGIGQLAVFSLKSGEYVLKNTKAPDGWNKADEVRFTLSFDAATGTFASSNPNVWKGPDGLFHVSFRSERGTILPQTGGSGMVAFVLAGFGLASASAVILAIKHRRRAA